MASYNSSESRGGGGRGLQTRPDLYKKVIFVVCVIFQINVVVLLPRWVLCPMILYSSYNVDIYCNSIEIVCNQRLVTVNSSIVSIDTNEMEQKKCKLLIFFG